MSSEKETLEMRVAAIEDKLAQSSITPEEMRAFQKVSALAGSSATSLSPILCTSCVGTCVHVITISVPVSSTCHVGPCGIATQAAQPQSGGPGFGVLGK
jgi:hypothetical protein